MRGIRHRIGIQKIQLCSPNHCLSQFDEPSFDTFHKNKVRIYRAVTSAEYDNLENKWGVSPNLLTPTIRKKIPEVEKAICYFQE